MTTTDKNDLCFSEYYRIIYALKVLEMHFSSTVTVPPGNGLSSLLANGAHILPCQWMTIIKLKLILVRVIQLQ